VDGMKELRRRVVLDEGWRSLFEKSERLGMMG